MVQRCTWVFPKLTSHLQGVEGKCSAVVSRCSGFSGVFLFCSVHFLGGWKETMCFAAIGQKCPAVDFTR